jgi:phage FluMu protein Com
MESVRCGWCRRKLAEAQYVRLEIKCPRCGTLNILRAESPLPESRRAPTPEGVSDEESARKTGFKDRSKAG